MLKSILLKKPDAFVIKKSKVKSTDINDIRSASAVCTIKGVYEKMRHDMLTQISVNIPGEHYKKRSKRIADFMKNDKIMVSCEKISELCTKALNQFGFVLEEDDVRRIWFVTDHILIDIMKDMKFIASTNAFLAMIDECTWLHNNDFEPFREIEMELTVINEGFLKEYYKIRKSQAEKAAKKKGVESLYDEEIFSYYEKSEIDLAEKVVKKFLKIFESRDSFEKIAKQYASKLPQEELDEIDRLMIETIPAKSIDEIRHIINRGKNEKI